MFLLTLILAVCVSPYPQLTDSRASGSIGFAAFVAFDGAVPIGAESVDGVCSGEPYRYSSSGTRFGECRN